jgi:hypothetical protein
VAEASCGQARKIPAKWTKTFWSSVRRMMDLDRRLHKVMPEQCPGAAKETSTVRSAVDDRLKDALDTPGLVGHRAGEQALNLTSAPADGRPGVRRTKVLERLLERRARAGQHSHGAKCSGSAKTPSMRTGLPSVSTVMVTGPRIVP